MAAVELREGALVWRIEQLAEKMAQPVEQVLATAVETYLDQLERDGIRAETQAFWAMHDVLLAHYSGQQVAIYNGEVVDHDDDATRLELRVRSRFGPLPVLIAPVRPAGTSDLHWGGGHLAVSDDR